MDGRQRAAPAARQPRHAEHVRRHGRAGARRTHLQSGRRGRQCVTRRRARLQVLADAVCRRRQRRRTHDAPRRHVSHGRRRDAETLHVARRGRLHPGGVQARGDQRGRARRASARAPEAEHHRDARRGGPPADHRGPEASVSVGVPGHMARQPALVQGDLSEQYPTQSVDALRRRRTPAAHRVRQRLEPAARPRGRSAQRDRPAQRDRRESVAHHPAAAHREPADCAGRGPAGHAPRGRFAARAPRARAAGHHSRRVGDRAQRARAALHGGRRRVDDARLRPAARPSRHRAEPRQSPARIGPHGERQPPPGAAAQGPRGRRDRAVVHAPRRCGVDDSHVLLPAGRHARVRRRHAC